MKNNRIVWLTGVSGSGKTTLAKMVQRDWPCVILDGDDMRRSISLNEGFSIDDRRKHNIRVARLAKELSAQTDVIVSVIAPSNAVRHEIDGICHPTWIRLKNHSLETSMPDGHFYEEFDDRLEVHCIDTVAFSAYVCSLELLLRIKSWDVPRSLLIGRWQPFHEGHETLVKEALKKSGKVLIGVRDCAPSEDNPYTIGERVDLIRKAFPDEDVVRIMALPDIAEVCYGRKVGYGIRELRFSEKVESVSGTDIRSQ